MKLRHFAVALAALFLSGSALALNPVGLGGGVSAYTADVTTSDYNNDYSTLAVELTGLADGKAGTFSAWLRIDGGDGTLRLILANGANPSDNRFAVSLSAGNKFQVGGGETAGTVNLYLDSTTTYTAGATWRHVMLSWDLSNAARRHLYVTDVSDLTVNIFNNVDLDYTRGEWAVGAYFDATSKWEGCIVDLWFTPTYIDLSVTANRRKFITAAGKPASLGANGEAPTGTAPLVFIPRGVSNSGTGSVPFTLTGTLDTCSSNPSS